MKFLVLFALVGFAAAQNNNQYVWDLLNPALNAAEVQALLANARAGQDYPAYTDIPQTNFDCSSKKQPGFYSDPDTQCQVFHRCDQNGNMTSYICVNTTVFNQITLVCDYYFNVDCSKAQSFENFANSRLYQGPDVPLFDSPPADYKTPQQRQQEADNEAIASGQPAQPSAGRKPSAGGKKPAAPVSGNKNNANKATTKKQTASSQGRALDNTGSGNQIGGSRPAVGGNRPAAGGRMTPRPAAPTAVATDAATSEETTAASSEDTTAAASSEDTTAAAGGEDTTAASSEDTSAASSEDTTVAAGGEDTTAASSDDTTAASSDDTTAAAGGEDTTAAGGDESTTTAQA